MLVELMSGEKCEWDRKDQFKIWMNKLLFYNLVNSWSSCSVSKETQLMFVPFSCGKNDKKAKEEELFLLMCS